MNRCITVKGVGRYSAKPNIIILNMNLETQDMEYEKAMFLAEEQISKLRIAINPLGFTKNQLKTVDFNIDSHYASELDHKGEYQRYFDGYRVSHGLKLEFKFDTKLLGNMLGAVSESGCKPEINIVFGVKDKEAVCAALLEDAAKNGKKKAELLANASGAILGRLISVNYSWEEITLYSNTQYYRGDDCSAASRQNCTVEIVPEDINVSDTVTLVWELI